MRGLLALAGVLAGCGVETATGPRAEQCGTCHQAQYAQWQGSRHGQSTSSPVFTALLPRVERAWGATARARCVACHQPGHGGDETIGCVSCHQAIGNRGDANGALVVKLGAPIASRHEPTGHAPHEVATRGFFASASLCGTCHEVRGPGHLDEPTLTEYRATTQATDDSCLGCHFDEGHRFGGLEPSWGAPPEEATSATARARVLLEKALRLEVVLVNGAWTVRLTNRGAAHGVPTGMTSLRDVWVDVKVGAREFPRVMELGARLEDEAGVVALITDATRVTSRSLAAQASREWTVPASPGEKIEATLRARAVREEALVALGLDGAEVPLLEVRAR